MRPFVVDIFSVDSKNNVKRRRLETDSLESAMKQLEIHSQLPNVNRIVVMRRLGGGGVSKMKVWARSMAS